MSTLVAMLVTILLMLVATTDAHDATMTINSFERGGDGGGPSECDGNYHSNNEKIVALSTEWYDDGSRCGNFIKIHVNGDTVRAKVVDECDTSGNCKHNTVDASAAVWDAFGIYGDDRGEISVTWSDS